MMSQVDSAVCDCQRIITSLSVSVLLFVVTPHADDLNNFLLIKNLINTPVFNIYPSGIVTTQIARQLLIRWF